jgi:subtilisin family serine protease
MEKLKLTQDGPRGSGRYTSYHALWHLVEMGIVKDLSSFASQPWDAAAERGAAPTRVALIDTSVAAGHPNLHGAIAGDLAMDFFSSRLGIPEQPTSERLRKLVSEAPDSGPGFLPKDGESLWQALIEGLKRSERLAAGEETSGFGSPVRPATLPSFSAHGTAMAGLIGARPVSAEDSHIAGFQAFDISTGQMMETKAPAIGFAYAGVDPFCEIVPVSTNFDPEPEQLILTLFYSVLIGAEVIVLARDFPSPKSLVQGLGIGDAKKSHAEDGETLSGALGVGLTTEELELWDLLDEVVVAVSKRIPVVCAAGNGGDDVVLSPGSLSADDNGIILVGARTAAGQPASYSPFSDKIDIYAPSGDGERLDAQMQRLDTMNAQYYENDHSPRYRKDLGVFGQPGHGASGPSTYSPQDLISTDVPGRAGYNSSPFSEIFGEDDVVLDYRSAYCRFSGTSGAVALTAGFISLAIAAGEISTGEDGDGKKVKARLKGGAKGDYETAEPSLHWSRLSK